MRCFSVPSYIHYYSLYYYIHATLLVITYLYLDSSVFVEAFTFTRASSTLKFWGVNKAVPFLSSSSWNDQGDVMISQEESLPPALRLKSSPIGPEEDVALHPHCHHPLTVILPAYNEELRIQQTLLDYGNFLLEEYPTLLFPLGVVVGKEEDYPSSSQKVFCNILVVDDGSTDDTVQVVKECRNYFLAKGLYIDCLSLCKNEGKGSAICRGLEYLDQQRKDATATLERIKDASNHASIHDYSKWIVLVSDADGSGDIQYLNSMLKKLWEDDMMIMTRKEPPFMGMVVGKRLEGDSSTPNSRKITRWGFQVMVKILLGGTLLGVDDTQCGFKLMTLDAGLATYSNLNLKRWTHDVEVLYRAKELKIPVVQVEVGWEDKEGSKLTSSALQTVWISGVMLWEIIYMRMQYMLKRWKVTTD